MALSTLLQAVSDVVREHFVKIPGTIVLDEKNDRSTCVPVVIKKSGPALLLKLDNLDAKLFPLFRNENPEITSLCDYIVLYEPSDKPKTYVLLCELKSSNTGGMKTHARKQIENTKMLAEYIIDMAAHHALKQPAPDVAYRGITFVGRGVLEPKGLEKRPLCPYRRHVQWENVGLTTLPASTERHISYFCHDSFLP